MHSLLHNARYLFVALVALALSAGLAFGATPPAAAPGLANAASHAGKTVPVAGGEEDPLGEDDETVEEGDDETEAPETEGSEEAGENCAIDPSALSEEDLAAMKHGSLACWAAHQTEWPEWFANHGAFVRCWAHQGKADAVSCTEEPTVEEGALEESGAETAKGGQDKGKGKAKANAQAKGKSKHQE